MNFNQMHERLRVEILHRIHRGTLSLSLLARQTGFGQSHLSNFLHSRRQLSLDAMDRILTAQQLTAADLLPASLHPATSQDDEDPSEIPIVTHGMAPFEPYIRSAAVHSTFRLPNHALRTLRTRAVASRHHGQRFVAVRISEPEAHPMKSLVLPNALVVIDRHYNSLVQYRTEQPTIYAVRQGVRLALRYVDFLASRLVLRPHNITFPIDLIEIEDPSTPNDYIAGRVVLVLNST